MYEGDGSCFRRFEPVRTRRAAVEAQYRPDEEAEYGDRARIVIRETVAKRVRKAQYPLANRYARDDSVYDVRREICHAFAAAARA